MLELHGKINEHVRQLAGRIGTRYIGSRGNHAAREYIHREMERDGLSVEIQEFACPDWTLRRILLEAQGIQLRAFVDPFSPPVDVTAPVVPACTIAELQSASIGGKIAFLYGDLTAAPVAPKQWFLKTGRDDELIGLLEDKRPAAVLSAQPNVPYFTNGFCDADFLIPAATLPRDAAADLLRKDPPAVRLLIESGRRPGSTANIVGRRTGARPESIVLCAHYDTALETPGACDNAGGAAILLALAEHWAGEEPAYGLEFVAFSGHEYLPLGDDVYWKSAAPDNFVAALNFDGAGHILAANTLTAMAASDELIRMAQSKLRDHPGAVWVEPWPESNHTPYAMRGVPALAFGSVGAREVTHSSEDTVDGVSVVKLNEAASLAAEIVMEVQGKNAEWGRG